MSVCGHLFLVAIIVTSVTFFVERTKLVAPDRIQIVEIDLDDVTVSGKETKLYNNVSDNDVDSNTKLYNQGQKKKEMIENVMPKYSRQTWKEILTNPEYSWDEKLELVMNGIGGALSAGETKR